MSTNNRNRSEGWQHAKLSGHKFEEAVSLDIITKGSEINTVFTQFQKDRSLDCLPISASAKSGQAMSTSIINGVSRTQNKTDLEVKLNDGTTVIISIKKSMGGQVHLTKLKYFLESLTYYNIDVPSEVSWVLKAFTGETDKKNIFDFAPEAKGKLCGPFSNKHHSMLEIYQNRLFANTLKSVYPQKWNLFYVWFNQNLAEITRIVFSTGHIKEEQYWAKVIYYGPLNTFFEIERLVNKSSSSSIDISPTGSTLYTPWGFIQAHRPGKSSGPYQLQFHHTGEKISRLMV